MDRCRRQEWRPSVGCGMDRQIGMGRFWVHPAWGTRGSVLGRWDGLYCVQNTRQTTVCFTLSLLLWPGNCFTVTSFTFPPDLQPLNLVRNEPIPAVFRVCAPLLPRDDPG